MKFPNRAWEPLLAAMRRMQVQAPTELPCVMPQYLMKRLPACGLAGGVSSKESFAGSDLALGLHQSPQRNPTRLLKVNERLLRCNSLHAARLRRAKVAGTIAYSSLQC